MALSSPFTVRIEEKQGSFGVAMNEIRAWLAHRLIQPELFKAADHGARFEFEITFSREDEAHLFEHECAALVRRVGSPA